MQSRRDLFQAHRLMTQRASLALLRGEPDVPDQPMRRLNVATFSGLLVTVIITAIFVIWGIIGHGGTTLQNQGGTLIIDQQTGQAYVFCDSGNEVCPVVNYASARLDLQSDSVTQQTVSQGTLAKYARGPLLGIPGLPPLPDSSLLITQPWSVCTQTKLFPAAGFRTTTTLAVGINTGGSSLGGNALLTQAQGQDWVIWDGQRMAVQQSGIEALFSSLNPTQPPTQVPSQWLDALPQGPAFAPPPIPDQGQTVTGPAGSPVQVGQVYSVAVAGGTQYYVMLKDGLALISLMQRRLLQFQTGASQPASLNSSQVPGHLSKSTVPGGGLPATPPVVAAPDSTEPLCVVYTSAGAGNPLTSQVDIGGNVPSGAATGDPAGVDQVALPPGKGTLVGDATGAGNSPISYFLVTSGRRYALSSTEVAGFLGYSLSQAVQMPAGVVDLIPAGPPLSPSLASSVVPPVGNSG